MNPSMRISVAEAPITLAAFRALHAELGSTPHGAAVAMTLALWTYADRRDEGAACVAAALDPSHRADGEGNAALPVADRQRLDLRIVDRPELLRSYVVGTSPTSGYALPDGPLVFEVSENPHSGELASGTFKVFLACSGADSPRPVTLHRDSEGMWHAWEWSSLTLGVRDG